MVWPQQEAQASRLRVSARTLTFQFEPLLCPEFFQHSGPRASGDVSSLDAMRTMELNQKEQMRGLDGKVGAGQGCCMVAGGT